MSSNDFNSTPITPELVKEHGLNEEEYKLVLEIMGREPNIKIVTVASSDGDGIKLCVSKNLLRLGKTGACQQRSHPYVEILLCYPTNQRNKHLEH